MTIKNREQIIASINDLSKQLFEQNKRAGWWDDLDAINKVAQDEELRNKLDSIFKTDFVAFFIMLLKCQKLALIHSEVSEAMEGLRKNLKDDHLPNFDMFSTEIADVIIRSLDLASAFKYPIADITVQKIEYNSTRADHQKESRNGENSKQF